MGTASNKTPVFNHVNMCFIFSTTQMSCVMRLMYCGLGCFAFWQMSYKSICNRISLYMMAEKKKAVNILYEEFYVCSAIKQNPDSPGLLRGKRKELIITAFGGVAYCRRNETHHFLNVTLQATLYLYLLLFLL